MYFAFREPRLRDPVALTFKALSKLPSEVIDQQGDKVTIDLTRMIHETDSKLSYMLDILEHSELNDYCVHIKDGKSLFEASGAHNLRILAANGVKLKGYDPSRGQAAQ